MTSQAGLPDGRQVVDVRIPRMGLSGDDVGIRGVLVGVGDVVDPNQTIAEIEGDKVTFEVPAGCAGVVTEVLVAAGQDARISDVIVRIALSGDGGFR